ncbi:hypothetical protein PVAND_009666 [Polypedilum vanderplanki]|uniref:Peptidase M14 domain-containing protein n=1 Tax=Polypedilum vanderplanki TaxID=319348 RepID=A0A9J6CDY3_POLVA|nr:hypothetical protein PVAND_009666 [Polypedilum vanderplanki]
MKLLTCGFLFALIFSIDSIEKARFDFYRVYEVKAENENQLKVFQQILDYPDGYRFLTNAPAVIGMKAQLIVPPHKFGEWSELVKNFFIDATLIDDNLQNSIDKEEARYLKRKAIDWNSFWRLNEIHSWLDELAASRPNDIRTFSVGTSYEGRDIKGVKINVGGGNSKPSVFFEANIHANEWIGSATATFIINELLTSNDTNVQRLLNYYDWWFLPVFNVDGYEYTWTVDRTWRKTRRVTSNPLCRGSDPNRNWDVNWGSYGGSNNPCSSGYYGDFVFSEPETRQLANFLNDRFTNLFGYISFHSFGRLLMTPYAYSTENSTHIQKLNEIGAKAVDEIATFRGASYTLGTISRFFGLVAGSSVDYVELNQKPTLTYCYELSTNHILPNDEIKATGQEIFASIKTIFSEAIDQGLA